VADSEPLDTEPVDTEPADTPDPTGADDALGAAAGSEASPTAAEVGAR
jgi:hypothetical protein